MGDELFKMTVMAVLCEYGLLPHLKGDVSG
jgi:hypothetical protein